MSDDDELLKTYLSFFKDAARQGCTTTIEVTAFIEARLAELPAERREAIEQAVKRATDANIE